MASASRTAARREQARLAADRDEAEYVAAKALADAEARRLDREQNAERYAAEDAARWGPRLRGTDPADMSETKLPTAGTLTFSATADPGPSGESFLDLVGCGRERPAGAVFLV